MSASGKPSLYADIGWRIKRRRVELGWSQADLGERLCPKRSHAAVSDIERAKTKPDLDYLQEIAVALSVPLSWLLDTGTYHPHLDLCAWCGDYTRNSLDDLCVECRALVDSIPGGYYLRETADGAELVRKEA